MRPERRSRPHEEPAPRSLDDDTTILRRRRLLEVEVESRYCARVRGPGVRGLVMELKGGKVPVWSSVAKAYTVSERTAADVVALAERRGYDVTITGPRSANSVRLLGKDTVRAYESVAGEQPGPGSGLW